MFFSIHFFFLFVMDGYLIYFQLSSFLTYTFKAKDFPLITALAEAYKLDM